MQTGYYNAAGGMVTQFNRLEMIANNLANVNTNGFKKDNEVVGDFMRLYKESRDELPNKDNTIEGAKFLNRTMSRVPQITEVYTNHNLGSMKQTDNDLDFALSQEGVFFAVNTPQGIRLTRDGSFTLNDDGVLVTKQGYEVLSNDYFSAGGNISFDSRDSVIKSDANGQLSVDLTGTAQFRLSKKLMIVQPQNLKALIKEGDNLYVPANGDLTEIRAESGAVKQGFLEGSNVNAVKEMTAMIETNRLVGMYQKVMDSQMNDLNRDAIEKIAAKR